MIYTNSYPLRQASAARFMRSQATHRPYLAKPPKTHKQRVGDDLRAAGLSWFGLGSMEGRYISQIIHADEHIGGAVYGHTQGGYAMIIATDSRIIFLDSKPLFVSKDEITYGLVGGISCGKVGPWATVTLHTKLGEYKLKSAKYASIKQFVDFIEQRCLEHKLSTEEYNDDFSPHN